MSNPRLSVLEIMTILQETPPRIAALTNGLTEEQLHAPPAPGAWAPADLLAHLRACQDVLGGCILRILAEERPTWRHADPRTWQRRSGYRDLGFGPSLEAFVTSRRQLLDALTALPAAGWDRTATVVRHGGVRQELSAWYYGDWLAGHEQRHIPQIAGTVAAVRG